MLSNFFSYCHFRQNHPPKMPFFRSNPPCANSRFQLRTTSPSLLPAFPANNPRQILSPSSMPPLEKRAAMTRSLGRASRRRSLYFNLKQRRKRERRERESEGYFYASADADGVYLRPRIERAARVMGSRRMRSLASVLPIRRWDEEWGSGREVEEWGVGWSIVAGTGRCFLLVGRAKFLLYQLDFVRF